MDQFVAVLFSNTASVNDSAVGGLFIDALKVSSDPGVDFIDLFGGGGFASADGPDWFVSQNNVVPIGHSVSDSVKLSFDDFNGVSSLSFGKSFTETEDDFETQLEAIFKLFGNNGVSLSEMSSSLRVTQNDPLDVDIQKLFGSNFTSEGAE